jgi:hypothetical protein
VFRERRPVGVLEAGESLSESFDAFVFGSKDTNKEVSVVVEYHPEGATAIFAKDASFMFAIEKSPVSVSLEMPDDLRIGQDIKAVINYTSQAEIDVSNLWLTMSLPDGFEFGSAIPSPVRRLIPFDVAPNELVWQIGDLMPAEAGTIEITGSVEGINLASKAFGAKIGAYNERTDSLLVYGETIEVSTLRSPFLEVVMLVNGESEHIASPGDALRFEIGWRNNLSAEVRNAVMEVQLEGDALNLGTLSVDDGLYNQSTQSIIWNATSYDRFKSIEGNDAGNVSFSVRLKNNLPLDTTSKRPAVEAKVKFSTNNVPEGFQGIDITGSNSAVAKVSSRMQFDSRVLYFNSPILNSGPIPPRVSEETTYTVVWSITNMTNDIDDVVVRSSLLPNINFKNIISPSDVDVAFDSDTGELVWRVGRVLAGTGFLRPALSIAFQIGLIPSLDQVGQSPVLINEATAEGKDTFTGVILTDKDKSVTISLPDDSGIGSGGQRVFP